MDITQPKIGSLCVTLIDKRIPNMKFHDFLRPSAFIQLLFSMRQEM